VEEELAVAFHAEDRGIDEGEGLAAEVVDGGLDAVDGELVGGGVAEGIKMRVRVRCSFLIARVFFCRLGA
jgi:hypothetical protein